VMPLCESVLCDRTKARHADVEAFQRIPCRCLSHQENQPVAKQSGLIVLKLGVPPPERAARQASDAST